MSAEEKMMKMFREVYPDLSYSDIAEYYERFPEEPTIVVTNNHKEECWHVTRSELLFEYITREWK